MFQNQEVFEKPISQSKTLSIKTENFNEANNFTAENCIFNQKVNN